MKTPFKFDGANDPVQPRKRRAVRVNPKWDKLAQDSVAAANAGMTYGKFVAARYERERRQGWSA